MTKQKNRPYQLKHALQCNPAVGPSLIQHWAKQRYLMHGNERHGSLERLTFSFSELVYLSLLVRLSCFGAITKDTTVSYPISSTNQSMSPTDREVTKLDAPEPVFTILQSCDWNKILVLSPLTSTVGVPTPRSKQMGIRYLIHLRDQEAVQKEFDLWRVGFDFSASIAFIDASRVKKWVADNLRET